MIGAYRYFYNKGVEYLKNLKRDYYIPKKGCRKKPDYIKYEGSFMRVETGGVYAYGIVPSYDENGKQLSLTGFQTIRNRVKENIPEWFVKQGLPVHLIDQACRECANNFTKIIEKVKKDGQKFNMRYKSKKKSPQETINMEKCSLNKNGFICKSLFKKFDSRIYTREPLDFINNKHEYKIIYNRNSYEYHVSMLVNKKELSNDINEDKWCSIDGGEVGFCNLYNPYDNQCMILGKHERNSFNDIKIDKLKSKISKNGKKKTRTKALQRLINQDKNKRLEMHHKISNYLCSNFKHIIIGKYGISSMKNLHSKVNRSMRNLAFYDFVQFLKHKCAERNVKLYIIHESNTTKACCRCGYLNKPINRNYECKKCHLDIHRDMNGAINIGLKSMC